jgi:hypothetical protein
MTTDEVFMKPKIIKMIIHLFPVVCFCCCTTSFSQQDLYGVWAGKNSRFEMTITFNQDLSCSILYQEKDAEPITYTGQFEADFTKKPVPLSIRNIPGLNHPLHTIIQFASPDIMKMADFAPRWRLRPISFDRETEITLIRKD